MYEKSGALHLTEPGLATGRQSGWQVNKMQVSFKNFEAGNIGLLV